MMENEKKEVGTLFDKITEFLLKETSLSLSLAYVVLIGIGMLFSYQFFSMWGLDIFQFAGFSDFFLAPFRDLLVLLFVLISVLVTFLAIRFSRKLDRKYPHLSKYWNLGVSVESKNYNRYMNFNLVAGMLLYLHMSSVILAVFRSIDFKKHPENHRVEIEMEDHSIKPCLLLGITEKFAIILDEKDKRVSALPMEGGVRMIRYPVKPPSGIFFRLFAAPASGPQVPD
jgi:hypothetical protein